MRSWRRRKLVGQFVDTAIILLICLAFLFPVFWGLSTSLKATDKILSLPPELIPSAPTLSHYITLFNSGIGKYILNSLILSAGAVFLSLLIGTITAYAFARMQFAMKGFFSFLVIAIMSIPLPSLIVPTFSLFAQVGLVDSLLGLILLYAAYQLPITVWLLSSYIQTLPPQLESAAMLDGYSRLQVLRKIVLPLSGPGLIAASLFTIVFAWNDFVVAVAMISTDANRTLPLAIYNYLGFFGREWGPLTASAIVAIVPVVLVFVFFQKYFLSGLAGGGVKG